MLSVICNQYSGDLDKTLAALKLTDFPTGTKGGAILNHPRLPGKRKSGSKS